jgi:hypothetical protein
VIPWDFDGIRQGAHPSSSSYGSEPPCSLFSCASFPNVRLFHLGPNKRHGVTHSLRLEIAVGDLVVDGEGTVRGGTVLDPLPLRLEQAGLPWPSFASVFYKKRWIQKPRLRKEVERGGSGAPRGEHGAGTKEDMECSGGGWSSVHALGE